MNRVRIATLVRGDATAPTISVGRHPSRQSRRLMPIVVTGLAGLAAAVVTSSPAQAQGARCLGNKVMNQAPYSCAVTKVIEGITFSVALSVDAGGRAVVGFAMAPPQPVDVPISVHNYTGISQSPRQFVDGTIPAGATTAQIVVAEIECGQFDIKAVHTAPGAAAGHITGPLVTWGENCHLVATTTTAGPSTIASTTPSTIPSNTPSTGASTGGSTNAVQGRVLAETESANAAGPESLPVTGGIGPLWIWGAGILGLASVLVIVSRRRGSVFD